MDGRRWNFMEDAQAMHDPVQSFLDDLEIVGIARRSTAEFSTQEQLPLALGCCAVGSILSHQVHDHGGRSGDSVDKTQVVIVQRCVGRQGSK
jgi:hypothetical protein